MKKLFTFGLILSGFLANAQAYSGKGDQKFQVGANIQDHGTGIVLFYDHGIGENMSVGVQTGYLLGVDEPAGFSGAKFEDRFDLKARFNANLGSVIGLPSNFDVYPGLNLGLRNFGGHAGVRYFFSEGFGLFSEVGFPIAKYDNNVVGYEKLNNQFQFNIGACFNL